MTSSLRVLVCDDDVEACEALVSALDGEQIVVEAVHNGTDAVRALASGTFAAAFLDIGLPDISGFEVATQVRRAGLVPRIRLIAVTGRGQASDREKSRQAGFDLHLTKPIRIEQIVAALSTIKR